LPTYIAASHTIFSSVQLLPAIAAVARDRKLVIISIASAISYVIAYLFITGAAVYYPNGAPPALRNFNGIEPPELKTTFRGVYFVPSDYLASFVTYDAMAFLAITSILFGLSISLFMLNRRIEAGCRLPGMGMFGIIPAIFTTFSCCGGGMMLLAIGPAAFSTVAANSPYFMTASVVAMLAGTVVLARRATMQIKGAALNNTKRKL
jgi:hypothetical protein